MVTPRGVGGAGDSPAGAGEGRRGTAKLSVTAGRKNWMSGGDGCNPPETGVPRARMRRAHVRKPRNS